MYMGLVFRNDLNCDKNLQLSVSCQETIWSLCLCLFTLSLTPLYHTHTHAHTQFFIFFNIHSLVNMKTSEFHFILFFHILLIEQSFRKSLS